MMSNVNTFHVIKDIGLDPRIRSASIIAVVIAEDPEFKIKDRYTGVDKEVKNYTLSDNTGIIKFGVFGKDKIQLFSRILKVGGTFNFFNLKIPINAKHKAVNSAINTTIMPTNVVIEYKEMHDLYEDLSVLKYHEIPNVSINIKAKVYQIFDIVDKGSFKIRDFMLIDKFGFAMRLTVWNKDIEQFKECKFNDTIILEGVVVHYNEFRIQSFINFPSGAKASIVSEEFNNLSEANNRVLTEVSFEEENKGVNQ